MNAPHTATPSPMMRRVSAAEFNAAWGATLPATLDAAATPASPFREPIQGLVTREVDEPELFQVYFG